MLSTDIKSRNLIGVNKEAMKEPIKCLIIGAKVLACKCLWDILLVTEDALKVLAGNILTTKSVRLQTEYMGIRKTNVTFHEASLYIGVGGANWGFSLPSLERSRLSRLSKARPALPLEISR